MSNRAWLYSKSTEIDENGAKMSQSESKWAKKPKSIKMSIF